ncbi:MAG: hypothetical protein OXE77_04180 [Flavobacteriaceae bacterium]|nr:hypothetical protein [Flavobacteriaceae bacterium]MCY4266546.1 hypothetical protein [Flavobacteriaceae bacterium]
MLTKQQQMVVRILQPLKLTHLSFGEYDSDQNQIEVIYQLKYPVGSFQFFKKIREVEDQLGLFVDTTPLSYVLSLEEKSDIALNNLLSNAKDQTSGWETIKAY